jgi:membrane-bound metal-dependent hydrolase YbcI (DUF457 family)
MLGITHALISLALAKSLGLIGIRDYLKIFVLVFYAMLPDIDMPYSGLGKIAKPISEYLYSKFGHRNVTHSLLFMLLVTSPLAINQSLYFLALLGYGSHLIEDMLTYTGVPLFYPSKKNFVILGGPLITGGWIELVLSLASVAIFVFG